MNFKHRIRDALIWLLSRLGFAFWYRRRKQKQGPLVRVLAFHDVPDREWFVTLIELLAKRHHIISPADFKAQRFLTDQINVLLTFDDGYQSWVDVVLPVLQAQQVHGLFFITSGLLDVATDTTKTAQFMHDRLWLSPKTPLTWDGAKALVAAGQSVGGHTVSHPVLATLSETAARAEIMTDKQAIEDRLGITLTDFAYPFGRRQDYTPAVQTVVYESGYHYDHVAESAFVTPRSTTIPRTLIEAGQSPASVHRWVTGGYDLFRALYLSV